MNIIDWLTANALRADAAELRRRPAHFAAPMAPGDLAETNPTAFRRTKRYRDLMAAGGDAKQEEPSLIAAFGRMVEEAVDRANAKR